MSFAYLADVVFRDQYIPCCKVSVDEILLREVLQPHDYLLGKTQEYFGGLWRNQLSRAVRETSD